MNVNIAFKEHWLKSPKDLDDARHLRIVYADQVNEDEILRIASMLRRLR